VLSLRSQVCPQYIFVDGSSSLTVGGSEVEQQVIHGMAGTGEVCWATCDTKETQWGAKYSDRGAHGAHKCVTNDRSCITNSIPNHLRDTLWESDGRK